MVRSGLVELDGGGDGSELELRFLQVLYESIHSVHGLATSLATSATPLITHLLSCSCFKSVKIFVPVCCLGISCVSIYVRGTYVEPIILIKDIRSPRHCNITVDKDFTVVRLFI
jgi:hypothetical protein